MIVTMATSALRLWCENRLNCAKRYHFERKRPPSAFGSCIDHKTDVHISIAVSYWNPTWENHNTQDMHMRKSQCTRYANEQYLTLYGVQDSHSTRIQKMQFESWKFKGLCYKIRGSVLLITKLCENITLFLTAFCAVWTFALAYL